MYELANQQINQGLSLGARILLGVFASLFGIVMVLCALPGDKAIYSQICGGYFLLIGIACFTRGRVRQCVGSAIGCGLFFLSIWYLVTELHGGYFLSRSRGEPSVFNFLLFLIFFGVPGVGYAAKTLFGFRVSMIEQPAPKVSEEDIIRVVERDFPDYELPEILTLLSTYGS